MAAGISSFLGSPLCDGQRRVLHVTYCPVLGSAEKMGWPSAGWRVCFWPVSSTTVTHAFVFCLQCEFDL